MLPTFPELLAFSPFAALLLRVALGVIFFQLGYVQCFKKNADFPMIYRNIMIEHGTAAAYVTGGLKILVGICLIIGLFTQVSALIAAILTVAAIYATSRSETLLKRDVYHYVLVFIVALSLIFTGAGSLAIDLPLLT
jgi:uncharacterized membrane protein YphA (DoxX/SURF4 family)